MPTFIVNKNQQSNGDHEVHNATKGCRNMPNPQNQIDLGSHTNCHGAVTKAKNLGYKKVNGCYFCCYECHTS